MKKDHDINSFTEGFTGGGAEEENEDDIAANIIAVINKLLSASKKIKEGAPAFVILMEKLSNDYGKALRPISEKLLEIFVDLAGYSYKSMAQAKQSLMPALTEFETAKAAGLFMKLSVLKDAGFSHRDAMALLIAEVGKRSDSPVVRKVNDGIQGIDKEIKKRKNRDAMALLIAEVGKRSDSPVARGVNDGLKSIDEQIKRKS